MPKQILNGIQYGTSRPYVELTQAEYENLPDSKNQNGVMYFIKDGGTGRGIKCFGLADIYSTAEKEIGVWIDGRPLYQKTISFTLGESGAYRTYSTGITNVDFAIIDFDHTYYNNSPSKIQARPYCAEVNTMDFAVFASVTSSNEIRLDYRVGASSASKNATVTLQYR